MKEFIFIWNIENISHSWHKKGEPIVSPSFVADTLQKTFWRLSFYPRGKLCSEYLSLYLHKVGVCSKEFLVEFELSCVSASFLTLESRYFGQRKFGPETTHGSSSFFRRHAVFDSKRELYLPQDTLRLCCRLWIRDESANEIGQCFGCTRLVIESVTSIKIMDPRKNNLAKVAITSKQPKALLVSVNVHQQKDGLQITLHPTINSNIKFFTLSFSAVGKDREPYDFVTSWFNRPVHTVWRSEFSEIEKLAAVNNKLKITCELVYPTGQEIKSMKKVNPCSFKLPQFGPTFILPCISSFQLSDYPDKSKGLWNLYTKKILCDVELKTLTTSFWVHKVVLCAHSPVFLAMFTHVMKERLTNCVEVEDLEADTLKKLITFIYSGIFEETNCDAVMKLYYSANKYQIERLKQSCCSYFVSKIDDLNVHELLMVADRYSDYDLRWNVDDYIYKHKARIFKSSTWKGFVDKQPIVGFETMIRVYKKIRDILRNEEPVRTHRFTSDPNITEGWYHVYLSQIGSDISVQTWTNTFPAHKSILCACSSTLNDMFQSGTLTETLKMLDLEEDTVSHLLLFLYTDSLLDISLENVAKLYHAAVAYQIERLRIYCSCFFLANFDALNANKLLKLAHVHEDVRLKSLMEELISLDDLDKSISEASA